MSERTAVALALIIALALAAAVALFIAWYHAPARVARRRSAAYFREERELKANSTTGPSEDARS